MRINYNASAMRANNALNVTDKRVSSSLQKLSSGLKVNSAKDNPSGYAIGRRMDAQISGVSVATRNANTGISIIETADGALTEVHDMLQRMNELAVKGSTGTLTSTDRETLNQELIQLKAEVTRIAQDTEFNGQPLLDGSFDLRGYTDNLGVKVGYYSDEVMDKVYTVNQLDIVYSNDGKGKIDLDRTQASFQAGNNFPSDAFISSVGENSVTITDSKGFEITLNVPALDEPNAPATTLSTGASAGIDIVNNTFPKGDYNIGDIEISYDAGGNITSVSTNLQPGEGFSTATTITAAGNRLTITDPIAGGQLIVDVNGLNPPATLPGTATLTNAKVSVNETFTIQNMNIDITGIGAMDTQIGANEGQVLEIRIPTISLQRLGLTYAEVTTQESSDDANTAIKSAILYVSDTRSRLGAYQNRLEHTVSNLDVTNENMTSAYSRIMDVDLSEEMTTYTTQQVVEQAAISMLAQANERPSQVLQLLQ